LWIGLSFTDHETASAVELAAFRKGLLVLGCGDDAIRISPALTFREDQAAAGIEIFEEAVAEVEAAGA
jgi:4-aminobutyrate aminotransferase